MQAISPNRSLSLQQNNNNHKNNKNVKPCSRLSTARGTCLCNISWIQANWFTQYHAHKNTKTHVTLTLTYDLDINRLLEIVEVHARAVSSR